MMNKKSSTRKTDEMRGLIIGEDDIETSIEESIMNQLRDGGLQG